MTELRERLALAWALSATAIERDVRFNELTASEIDTILSAILTELEAAGWCLAPEVPTEEMASAGYSIAPDCKYKLPLGDAAKALKDIYTAMLRARPKI